MRPYAQIAADYCADVLAGRILACKWVRLACERQQRDLTRAADPAFPYTYDEAKGARVCLFIEKLPHIKGPLSGQTIVLEPWQLFILCTAFGWVRKDTGKRRFRRVYIEVPRGNGKSALSSGVALYMLAADGEGGPEVYSAARVKEQARIVFDVAKKMLRTGPGIKLRQHFGIQVLEHSIIHPASNGIFTAVSSDAQALDGGNVHYGCLDELHAHPTSEVYDVFDTATGKRDQSMLWAITTAGVDLTGICYSTRDYILKVLEGVFEDERWFGVVYTIDEGDPNADPPIPGDDWADPATWKKANPNYGVSVFPDDLEMKAKKALQQVSAQTNFRTKHLDIWQGTGSNWMDMRRFARCADRGLNEADFAGKQCVIGLDLAAKIDLLSGVRVFWEDIDGKRHYYAFWSHWMPELRIAATEVVALRQWAGEGLIQECPGESNDFNKVKDWIRDACRAYDVLTVGHDPWGALEMENDLINEGIPMLAIQQITKNFSPAMKELESAVYDGRFHFNGDPVTAWAVSNVIVKPDANDNIFPRKAKDVNKIDPAVALFNAIIRVMTVETSSGGVDVFGSCVKCGAVCAGKLKDGALEFICSDCKKVLDK